MPPRLAAVGSGGPFHPSAGPSRRHDVNGSVETVRTEVDSNDQEQIDVDTLYLQPGAFKRKDKKKWQDSGRSIAFALNPVGDEVATWVTHKSSADPNKPPSLLSKQSLALADQNIAFSSLNSLSKPLATLYTESHTLFTSLQHIVASEMRLPSPSAARHQAPSWDKNGHLAQAALLAPPTAETVLHIRRLVGMYLEEVVRLRENAEVDEETKARFDAVYHVFNLAMILYLPQDGRGEGLLGEELLDWVNDVDPAPDNTQGNEIMQTKEPWQHPSFWPYVARCILRGFHLPASSFLRSLSNHPHAPIAKLAGILHHHLSVFPRSHQTTQFPLESQFVQAHRSWLSRLRAEVSSFIGGRPKGRWLEGAGSEWASWEDHFRIIIELMEGRADRILEQAADWREAVGAWGVLVDVQLKRDDLPDVMSRILEKLSVDASVLDDSIESSLCKGNIIQALSGCQELDLWMAAHLGDVFDKLALVPDDEERFEMSLRDYFLLGYAEVLQTNSNSRGMWRMTCDYLAAAGEEGRIRLRQFILHISLGLDSAITAPAAAQTNGDHMDVVEVEDKPSAEDERLQHFTEVREACEELRLEQEWRTISKIMAERLIRKGEYGMAAAMCLQAEDSFTLSLIAERICDAYLAHGDQEYLRLVETLPPSLLNEAPLALTQMQADGTKPLDLPSQSAVSVFASRLTFLAEFRDYLLFLSQGARDRAAIRLVDLLRSGVAPVSMWAVLLVESVNLLEDPDILFTSNDSFELLRILEEVTSNSAYAPEEYLYNLIVYLVRHETSGADPTKSTKTSTLDIPKTTKRGTSGAYKKLEQVRLALARNLARALVVGFENPF